LEPGSRSLTSKVVNDVATGMMSTPYRAHARDVVRTSKLVAHCLDPLELDDVGDLVDDGGEDVVRRGRLGDDRREPPQRRVLLREAGADRRGRGPIENRVGAIGELVGQPADVRIAERLVALRLARTFRRR
jgi:hypothetical protein